MRLGSLVRQKLQNLSGPIMTVEAITAQGWIVCAWVDPVTRKSDARMFFPEMLVKVGSQPQRGQPE